MARIVMAYARDGHVVYCHLCPASTICKERLPRKTYSVHWSKKMEEILKKRRTVFDASGYTVIMCQECYETKLDKELQKDFTRVQRKNEKRTFATAGGYGGWDEPTDKCMTKLFGWEVQVATMKTQK